MLAWVFTFLVLALVSGALGLSGLELISLDIARILFIVFIALFAISLFYKLFVYRRPPMY